MGIYIYTQIEFIQFLCLKIESDFLSFFLNNEKKFLINFSALLKYKSFSYDFSQDGV